MPQHFTVKGVDPLGRIVELTVAAASAEAARAMVEETGLRLVMVVKPIPLESAEGQPDRPESPAT